MTKTAFLLLVMTTFFSCTQQNQKYDKRYMDFDSLMTRQLALLQEEKLTISKKATMGNSETSGVTPGDSVSLARELDIFRQMDIINKPLFRDQYQITDAPDSKSNLTVRAFYPKINSSIRFIKLYYLNDMEGLKKIEARFEEENSLYYTKRDYSLEFRENSKVPLISRSVVQGVQKMIMNDSVSFSVTSVYQATH